jgi:hypothetical protein
MLSLDATPPRLYFAISSNASYLSFSSRTPQLKTSAGSCAASSIYIFVAITLFALTLLKYCASSEELHSLSKELTDKFPAKMLFESLRLPENNSVSKLFLSSAAFSGKLFALAGGSGTLKVSITGCSILFYCNVFLNF